MPMSEDRRTILGAGAGPSPDEKSPWEGLGFDGEITMVAVYEGPLRGVWVNKAPKDGLKGGRLNTFMEMLTGKLRQMSHSDDKTKRPIEAKLHVATTEEEWGKAMLCVIAGLGERIDL